MNSSSSRLLLRSLAVTLSIAIGLTASVSDSWSARESNVRATKHNLSKDWGGGGADTRTVKATTESQVCVFCHTPHAATSGMTPLWNRKASNAAYTTYTSSSLDAQAIEGQLAAPGGSSKLCLSCHDGTLAIGNVNVLNGAGSNTVQGGQSITMTGTGAGGVMPGGSGTNTGFTRFLGTDLSNDHPISVTYNKLLTDRDGELRDATLNPIDGTWEWVNGSTRIIGVRKHRNQGGSGQAQKPKLPLEMTGSATDSGQVQCATCHDPHIRETSEATAGNQKFLRQNRFQVDAPANAYNESGDQICLSCHNKNRGTGMWAFSAHANPSVASATYKATPAQQRDFPANIQVWQAGCLNCHDTHSIPGSRRLLREGTTGTGTPKAGGTSAIEETCYQCHSNSTESIVTPSPPDIKTDFTTKAKRMPIAKSPETHDIGGSFNDAGFVDCNSTTNKCGKDFIESREKLGVGNLANRHAECTDCHNPHRVIRGKSGLPGALTAANTSEARVNGASGGHHDHREAAGYTHTNVISGVLRGTWGVEPVYSSNKSFHLLPTGYDVKRGDPGNTAITDCGGANKANCDAQTFVTREYQICLKCHSDYGYTDDNAYPSGSTRPTLGGTNLTASPTSRTAGSFTRYTNQAKEFQAPSAHRGHPTTTDSGSSAGFSTNNHRSWHPVMDSTNRTGSTRGNGTNISNNWRSPWNNSVGSQTMYCTDCHGSEVTSATSVIPNGTNSWGPHGSANDFLLKAPWTTATGSGNTDHLCFRCHESGRYTGTSGARTGFWIGRGSRGTGKDGHDTHYAKINRMRCNWCHVAVPHGWKNKALLVNLNDVGLEAGVANGTVIANGSLPYSNGPYYRNAMLKIDVFGPSGNWSIGDCGTPGSSDDGARSWMQGTCGNPP